MNAIDLILLIILLFYFLFVILFLNFQNNLNYFIFNFFSLFFYSFFSSSFSSSSSSTSSSPTSFSSSLSSSLSSLTSSSSSSSSLNSNTPLFQHNIHIFISAFTGSITSVAILQSTKLFSHIYLGVAKSGNSVNIMKINIFLTLISASSGIILTIYGKGNPSPDYFG